MIDFTEQMNWTELKDREAIERIKDESRTKPVLIFKHSTRCNISRAALDRLERHWNDTEVPETKLYFLDLLSHRQISDLVADAFQIEHESPQVLLIRDGVAVYHQSHFGIDYDDLRSAIKS